MKKLWIVTVLVVSLLFFLGGSVQASKDIVISDSNEYGGKTVETTFEKGDEEYDHYKKALSYYDSNSKLRKLEAFFQDKYAKKTMTVLKIRYFDPNGKLTKEEVFPTKEIINSGGIEKRVDYYDDNKKVTKAEVFYSDKSVEKNGKVKDIMYEHDDKAVGRTLELETFYSVEYARKEGYNRTMLYYDKKARKKWAEYYMDDKLVETREGKL